MNYFNIKDTLENVAKLNFREDEIKYLGKSNKFFKNLFSDKEITKENVERYLYEYFDKIEKADFPLGHKYVNLNLDKSKKTKSYNEEDLNFIDICQNFIEKLEAYKNQSKINNKEENYVIS